MEVVGQETKNCSSRPNVPLENTNISELGEIERMRNLKHEDYQTSKHRHATILEQVDERDNDSFLHKVTESLHFKPLAEVMERIVADTDPTSTFTGSEPISGHALTKASRFAEEEDKDYNASQKSANGKVKNKFGIRKSAKISAEEDESPSQSARHSHQTVELDPLKRPKIKKERKILKKKNRKVYPGMDDSVHDHGNTSAIDASENKCPAVIFEEQAKKEDANEVTYSSGKKSTHMAANLASNVLRIQKWYRGVLGRRLAVTLRIQVSQELYDEAMFEMQLDASIQIQAVYRGHRVRAKNKATQLVNVMRLVPLEVPELVWPESVNDEPSEGWPSIQDPVPSELTCDQIRVFCGTWNLHAKLPEFDLRQWIGYNQYHVIAIGTEECGATIAKSVMFPSKKTWQELVRVAVGDQYVMVASHALAAIHNMLFIQKCYVPWVQNIQSDAVATGIGNQLGNKGGVGISLTIGKTSFAFINCHFEAHQNNLQRRNASFHRINMELKLAARSRSSSYKSRMSQRHVRMRTSRASLPALYRSNASKKLISESFDRVFWYGDMNYRIDGTRKMVDTLLLHRNHAVLLFNDQLRREIQNKNVFEHFEEGPLHFYPTYKFDTHSKDYDTSAKKRIPSWTDRILYRSNTSPQDIQLVRYTCEMELQTSDHRPVTAVFLVNTKLSLDAASQHLAPIEETPIIAPQSRVCLIQ